MSSGRMRALAVLVLLFLCGTLTTRYKGIGGRYYGFAYDMEKLSSPEEWSDISVCAGSGNRSIPCPGGVVWVLDAPLSLTADTLLLPVDAITERRSQEASAGW